MKGTLFIPYANSSCVRGFKYNGELTTEQYVRMETKEYNDHKHGVDTMMLTRYGNNMAYNNYDKRKFNYTKQQYDYLMSYFKCNCVVLNDEGRPQSMSDLERYAKTQEQFVLILNLNEKDIIEEGDIDTEIKKWISDSQKVSNCKKLSDVEVMYHLPKKDFRLRTEDKKTFILKDCKFLKIMSSVSYNVFAIIVSKIIFVNE